MVYTYGIKAALMITLRPVYHEHNVIPFGFAVASQGTNQTMMLERKPKGDSFLNECWKESPFLTVSHGKGWRVLHFAVSKQSQGTTLYNVVIAVIM